ncbi:MAG: TetR/AcrR family transcriptional regulator [Chloroflexi bacterium]|nr:TetR/AcrR family transcriptional regulator [Chloroflexota bacterium]MCC6894158.1 TetR/AcrR family transcriptional regulator [Anaerolineae bacterium]
MPKVVVRTQPKQKRGQQRVEAILNAASALFAEVGYEAATIVEIAARSDTSVGSLYQFFSNKEAILYAIVERYVAAATVTFANMEVESFPEMTLEQSIRAIIRPLKEFIRDNQDFRAIFASSHGPDFLEQTIRAMDEAMLARTDAALAEARPHVRPTDRRKASLVCMVIMKAMLGMTTTNSELSFDEIFEEMEAVYIRYLTPLMGG